MHIELHLSQLLSPYSQEMFPLFSASSQVSPFAVSVLPSPQKPPSP
jgi:hypothetical protein